MLKIGRVPACINSSGCFRRASAILPARLPSAQTAALGKPPNFDPAAHLESGLIASGDIIGPQFDPVGIWEKDRERPGLPG